MQSSELFFFVPLIQSQDDLTAAASRRAPQQSKAGTIATRRVPQGRQVNRFGKAAHGTMTTRPRKSGGSQMSQSRSSSDLAAMGSPCRLTPCGSADFAEVFAAVCACGPNDDDDDFDDDAGEKQPPCVDTASQKHHRPAATTTTAVLPSPIIPMIRSFSELERGGCMVSIHEVTTTTTDGNVEVLVTISVATSPLVEEGHAKGTSAFAPPSVSTGTMLAVHKPANAWTQRNTQRQRQSAARRAAKEQATRLRLQLMELSRDCFAGRFRIEREATQGLKATSLEARRYTALERASPQKRQQQSTAAPAASCSPDKLASRGLTALSQDALLSMAHDGSAPVEAVVVTSAAAPLTMTGGADDVYEPEDILVLRAALQNLGSVMELRSKAAHHIHALLKPGETGVRDAAAKRAARDRNELQETLQLLGNHLLREAERRIAADAVANDDDENDHPAGKSAGRQLSTEASSILQFCASAWQVATAAATPQRKLPSPPHSTVKCRRTRSQDEKDSAAAGGGSDAIESATTAPTARRTVLPPESSERITAAMRSARASRSMISAFYLDLERLLKVTIGDSHGGSTAPPRGLDEVHTAAEVLVTAIGALVNVVDSDPSAVAVPLRWAEVDRLAVAVATAWKAFDDRLEASRLAARDGLIHGLCHAYVSMFRVLSAARGSATAERTTATTTLSTCAGDTHADPQTTCATAQAAARRHAQAAAFRQARRREATTAAAAEMSRLLQQLRRIGGQAAVDRATQLAAAATTA